MKGDIKNDIRSKLVIISVLILIPIGILYLNMGDELFNVRESLEGANGAYRPGFDSVSALDATTGGSGSDSGTPANGATSPAGSNFVNVCHPKKSNFYNINTEALEKVDSETGISAKSCKYKCDIGNCDLYLMNNDVCNLYKKTANADSEATFLEVNCNNKVLPSADPSNPDAPIYTSVGEGKIESTFYQAHKKNFKHINYLLDTANDIKGDYIQINAEIADLADNPESPDRTQLRGLYDTVNGKLEKVADYLELDKNSLYSNFVTSPYSTSESDKTNLGGNEYSQVDVLKEFKKQRDDTLNIEGRTINDTLVHNRKYLVYTILCILMILSVAILVIFKMAPDLISDKIVISYFMGVLMMLFFIHYYFKV
ncbi:hypothetical protein PGAG_00163 [Phaeocystis globosa virus 12T]|uniref:Uncharacterized protein n=1 Tax=Phaeocystis globosa virus PgV-16T TaxID=3071227 RepID=A0AC59EX25_9VIRU|nr:hypothetical protein PGCG_00204 [Phaeocystis globosa virus]AET73052.1 hypothetical protein PGAG_00163 [Phaeocystis globosa virus 12T]AET73875.1 hypothetical protein PGBG_00167 [Phaeocystis globosa virus 14T]AGM15515.1 hypothetical protein PGCG_00204 [Phaeocystis globosa virus PgV-16T]UYE94245.1 hypothetical protein PGV14T_00204 [Phaeocystis globosa virus]